MINRLFLFNYLNVVTIIIVCFLISCTKEPQIVIEPNTPFESPREPLEVKERDSILGEYSGMIHYFDQNMVIGNEIDTIYLMSYQVKKHGLDSIRIIPPLPLYFPDIPNEYFKYDSSNFYSGYYSSMVTGYQLDLKFKPDSSKMEFRTRYSVGLEYNSHYYEFSGEKD